MSETDPLTAAVIRCAVRHGWVVVALRGKNPGIWGRGVDWRLYATSDPDQIRAIAAEKNPTGWGLPLAENGILAVDLDRHDIDEEEFQRSKRGVEQLGIRFDQGLVARSGRDGLVAFYRRPASWRATNIRVRGVELRGNGQQVLPPSRHPNGRRYEWLHEVAAIPELPPDLLAYAPPSEKPRVVRPPIPPGEATDIGLWRMAGLLRSLERAPLWHNGLYVTARSAGALVDTGMISRDLAAAALRTQADAMGLTAVKGERSVERTIADGMKKGGVL